MGPVVDIEQARFRPGSGRAPDPPDATPHHGFVVGTTDLMSAVDETTLALLRRSSPTRRGRLVARSLAIADVAGLLSAYLIATLILDQHGILGSPKEFIAFIALLPC